MFAANKVRAERAAWDFMEKNKDKISFDLITLLPPLVSALLVYMKLHVD